MTIYGVQILRYDHDVSIFRKLGSNVLKMDHRFLAPAGPNVSFSSDLGPLRGPLMSPQDLIDILVYSGVLSPVGIRTFDAEF